MCASRLSSLSLSQDAHAGDEAQSKHGALTLTYLKGDDVPLDVLVKQFEAITRELYIHRTATMVEAPELLVDVFHLDQVCGWARARALRRGAGRVSCVIDCSVSSLCVLAKQLPK